MSILLHNDCTKTCFGPYLVVLVGVRTSRGQRVAVCVIQAQRRRCGDARESSFTVSRQVEGGLPGPPVIQRPLDDKGTGTRTLHSDNTQAPLAPRSPHSEARTLMR